MTCFFIYIFYGMCIVSRNFFEIKFASTEKIQCINVVAYLVVYRRLLVISATVYTAMRIVRCITEAK